MELEFGSYKERGTGDKVDRQLGSSTTLSFGSRLVLLNSYPICVLLKHLEKSKGNRTNALLVHAASYLLLSSSWSVHLAEKYRAILKCLLNDWLLISEC